MLFQKVQQRCTRPINLIYILVLLLTNHETPYNLKICTELPSTFSSNYCPFYNYRSVTYTCWYGVSISAVPDGIVSHYQPWRGWLQVWCYSYRCAITSDMSVDPMPLSDMPVCAVQICRHVCWVHLFRYTCLQRASPSGEKPGVLQIHQTRLQVKCGSNGFAKLISYQHGRHNLSDASAASLGCYKDDVCN